MNVTLLKGFTLVELLVAMAMAAVLLTIAIPSFRGLIRDARIAAESNRLVTALSLARGEASKGIPGAATDPQVTVCKADTTVSPPKCSTIDCGAEGTCWEMGWMVFKDANGNEQLDEEDAAFCGTSGNCVIGVFPALPQGFTIRTGTNIDKFVAFEPDGSASANGTFRLCLDADQGNARSIIVIMSGRVRSEKGDSCQ